MWATSSVVPRIMCDYPYIMGMGALTLYDELTAKRTRFLRVDELCSAAAERGALPSGPELAAEARRPLKEKQGLEKAQGAFLAEILADPPPRHALLPRDVSPTPAHCGAARRIRSPRPVRAAGGPPRAPG